MPVRISDAFQSHPHKHYPADFNSLHELPDSYAWTHQLDEYPSLDSSFGSELCVPIIDLTHQNVLKLIGHACKTWGVFQVTNHGIPEKLLHDIESTCRSLFSLPVQQKLKAARPADGISGYGIHRISSFFQKLMWSEGFTIAGSPLEHFRQLWPQDYNKFCCMVEEYEKEMKRLAGKLMWLILGSLGIPKEDVIWAGPKGDFEDASNAIQLNSYPACPDPNRAMGLAEHTDSTLLSIIHQTNISGLQILHEGAGWLTVPPVPGALVVNIGDLTHILSNGVYHNVLHRAIVNRSQQRLSIAYLYGPPASVQISPQSKLVTPSHPPLYRPITWKEYLAIKGKLYNKALSSIQLYDPLNDQMD
ncbi:gibberellin 3-beta-dioxygenase 1-like [Rosa rugosa]|uniref:gibberellin 3-beta-dioxygenase 1-like n=1 Tax=Rosa rugosa TaxID=74645 RepID=UPI002B402642|nr:gibberellin 3-beta-dioxygenase 1-like [Rosa rugosa]